MKIFPSLFKGKFSSRVLTSWALGTVTRPVEAQYKQHSDTWSLCGKGRSGHPRCGVEKHQWSPFWYFLRYSVPASTCLKGMLFGVIEVDPSP
jgi:hypothetical protein